MEGLFDGVPIEADWEGELLGCSETGGESRVILLISIIEAEYRFLPWYKNGVESAEECVVNFYGWQVCQV